MNPNPKNFIPENLEKSETAAREEVILQFWKDNQIFEKTLAKESTQGDFVFFEGPPTANGRPGIHHVGARSFKDIIPRYKTMRGFNVKRKAGWDTHGLPVELQVEKALGLKSKKEIEVYGVAAYNKKCKESVWEYKHEWEALTDRMGYWLDMQNPYVTYENSYIEALWGVVKKISERKDATGNDLMYKDFKILPWCSRCGTALSSHELNQPGAYQDVKDVTAYVQFKITPDQKCKEYTVPDNAYFLAWTTTPWTLPGNVALAVGSDIDYAIIKSEGEVWDDGYYILAASLVDKVFGLEFGKLKKGDWSSKNQPNDEVRRITCIDVIKGSDLVGLKYEPLYPFLSDLLPADQKSKLENAFQVYAADFVTTTDGTGIVHIAPMYGADDFELGTKHNLPKFHVVNEEGKYIAGCDTDAIKLSGRYVKESDESGKPTLAIDIINDLTARDLLFKKENYAHSYPHCWRCNTPLLYYARGSWYFRMSSLREKLLSANENINWEPDHIKKGRFGEWLDGIRDWAISRERYWGTPIPVWETVDGSKRVVVGSIDDIKKYSKKSGNKYLLMRHGQAQSNIEGGFKYGVWDFANNPDNHLTELGRIQVAESAESLKGHKIDYIIASPIVRAQETAKIVASTLGMDESAIITDDRMLEWNVGPEFQWKDLELFFQARNAAENRYTFKSEGAESFQDVIIRVGKMMEEFEKTYEGKNILIVGHGSSLRSIEMIIEGFTFHDLIKVPGSYNNFKNAEIREIDFTLLPRNELYELDFHKPYIDKVELEFDGEKLFRTSAIMDVWFDSGAMAYAQAHKLGEPVDFKPLPADYISEGVDQTRGWFYTMHAIANLLNDEPTNNYKNVICLGLLMAADGTKMSKSKGNIVSPWEIFEKFGADVARFWFYSVNQPGETKNFDEKSLDEVKKKVFNPLLNVVSFYEMYRTDESLDEDEYNPYINPTNVLDTWILAQLDILSRTVSQGLDEYDVLMPARAIRDFINELSTWYIRRSRDRFKSNDEMDRKKALRTTQLILRNLSLIMAPFTPFIAEEIWQKVKWQRDPESVHLGWWIDRRGAEYDFKNVISYMQSVRDIVTLGLEARQKANVKVRQPLSKLFVAESNLSDEYLEIIKDELNVKEILIKDSLEQGTVELDTEITDDLRNEGDMRDMVRMVQDMRKDANLSPSDRVIVHLQIAEPTWFSNSELQKELLTTVGAENIVWASTENKVEKK
jgi:isoleucyl-tRNA synthetase